METVAGTKLSIPWHLLALDDINVMAVPRHGSRQSPAKGERHLPQIRGFALTAKLLQKQCVVPKRHELPLGLQPCRLPAPHAVPPRDAMPSTVPIRDGFDVALGTDFLPSSLTPRMAGLHKCPKRTRPLAGTD